MRFPIESICEVLGVSRSGYYEHRQRHVRSLQVADSILRPMIAEIFWHHRRKYGARRIRQELIDRGYRCDIRRIGRLMKQGGLRAIRPKSFRPQTTQSRHRLGYCANLLLDGLLPYGINQIWVADITYIPLKNDSFVYLAAVMDRFSRRIVGWQIDSHMTERLTLAALRQAIAQRQPPPGLIHHSDRGSQYAAIEYRNILQRANMRQSMSRRRNSYDNAFMESCFGTLKSELEMKGYEDLRDADRQVSDYLLYYNVERRHSSLDYCSPVQFERLVGPLGLPAMQKSGSNSPSN